MVGIVICAHGNLANELLETLNFITGNSGSVQAVAVDHNTEVSVARKIVKDTIRAADDGDGALVVTDLYGGTPSNICMSLEDELKMEIISGVNLPILIKAVSMQKNSDLKTMAVKLKEYGKENIYLSSEILQGKNAKG